MKSTIKVLFITIGNENSASSRVYVYQYLPFLSEDGIKSTVWNFGPHKINPYKSGIRRYLTAFLLYFKLICKTIVLNINVLAKSKNYDVIFCQKVVLHCWVSRWAKSRLIYCIDDAVYLKKNKLTLGAFSNALYFKFLEGVNKIIVGTEDYYNLLEMFKSKMHYVPNALNISNNTPTFTDSKVNIGWIGSPNTSKYLNLIVEPLNKLASKYGDRIKFILIGADEKKHSYIENAEHYQWSLMTEAQLMAKVDIGLMPLVNDEWERGKCGYKILQYFSYGVPAVASPVGINKRIINQSSGGYLCENADCWVEKLSALIDDAKVRKLLGKTAREYIVQNHELKKIYQTRYKPVIFNEK